MLKIEMPKSYTLPCEEVPRTPKSIEHEMKVTLSTGFDVILRNLTFT